MRLNKKIEAEMTDRFESELDYIPTLDKVPFYQKRAAAKVAAEAAFEYLKETER